MKKNIIALGAGICCLLTACGGTPNVSTSFNCPERFDCQPLDAAHGTVTFQNAQTGVGGGTMGPLAGARNLEKAQSKMMDHFNLADSDIENRGTTEGGRPYVVFANKEKVENKSYAQVLEKEGAFFICWADGRSTDAAGTAVMGERVCKNMN